jgi:hypothetical protein
VPTIIHNLLIIFQANDIKSYEHVLIMKAGLAVFEKREISLKLIESDAFAEFESAPIASRD